jgi:hypothetical protein
LAAFLFLYWFFKGELVIDGEKKPQNPMEIVTAPLNVSVVGGCPFSLSFLVTLVLQGGACHRWREEAAELDGDRYGTAEREFDWLLNCLLLYSICC